MKPIPKARQLFRGDINDAVIQVQRLTGVEITPSWWEAHDLNSGSTEQILDKFDKLYETELKQRKPGVYA